jgi:hypothetical protein
VPLRDWPHRDRLTQAALDAAFRLPTGAVSACLPRRVSFAGPYKDWVKAKRHEIRDFIVTAFEEIAPGELEALHVAEEIAGELRPCGQIRIGLPSRTLWPALDLLRLPGIGEAIPVKPRLRVSAKFFGRHRSGIIRDGVVREMSVVE